MSALHYWNLLQYVHLFSMQNQVYTQLRMGPSPCQDQCQGQQEVPHVPVVAAKLGNNTLLVEEGILLSALVLQLAAPLP